MMLWLTPPPIDSRPATIGCCPIAMRLALLETTVLLLRANGDPTGLLPVLAKYEDTLLNALLFTHPQAEA